MRFGAKPSGREELVTMRDGVQVKLIWFTPAKPRDDAPVVVSLHGIGEQRPARAPTVGPASTALPLEVKRMHAPMQEVTSTAFDP